MSVPFPERDVLLTSETDIRIVDAARFAGREVTIRGWANQVRSSGKISFVEIRDGSGYLQAVGEKPRLDEESVRALEGCTHESSLILTGKVRPHPKRPEVMELDVTRARVVQRAEEYPLGRKEHGPDFLLENRHLWLRAKKQWAIQRIRDTIIHATYDFFRHHGFIKIDAPIITATACEGTTTLFSMDYHELGKAYLSQSGQLYIEAAVMSHGRVFDFGPVFRAEKSKTKKHLSEFWMMDAEMAYCDHTMNMRFQEELITFIVRTVLDQCRPELAAMERDTSKLEKVQTPFIRLTHRETVELLRKHGSTMKEDDDLGAPDEAILAGLFDTPIFIEKWPAKIKAFYMKRGEQDPSIVLGADLMAPEGFGEIIGGSQREDDYELLKERMIEEKIPLEDFGWYLDLRRYGSVPHAGFGFGLERLVAWLSGAEHIRETIPFPRMLYRFRP